MVFVALLPTLIKNNSHKTLDFIYNIYKEILPVITQIWTDLLSNISEEELLMCEKVLSKIKQNLVANVNIQM